MTLLADESRPIFQTWFSELRKAGRIEIEGRWIKSDGQEIDVWLTSTAVLGADGSFRYSRSVARDVTARRALEAELKDKNDRLAKINAELSRKNKELDEFTYIIAHDLKEPLRTLIAFSGFLEKDLGAHAEGEIRENLKHIVDAARRMRSLINDLPTLGRAGRVAGEFHPVRLDDLVLGLRRDFAELIRSRGAAIEVAPDLPVLWGDPVRLGQLFANLVGNGLKYNTSPSPRVEVVRGDAAASAQVRAETGAGFVVVGVRDNGIGIDPKFHDKIFELFRRLHTREEFEGTGAGLAICQKIVQAHGGRIWVESSADAGSTFYVRLPAPPHNRPTTPDGETHAS
jgi:light-regulated signal transduction histidine kinase (bacteriophytochrome)